jgi:FkbM family methyltransferase
MKKLKKLLCRLDVRKTVTVSGVKLQIDSSVMSRQMRAIIRSGQYEKHEARQIPRIVEDGDRVVELGAGVGFIGSLVAKTGKASSINIYEANPKLIPVIQRTKELNNASFNVHNAVVLSAEVSSHEVPFYVRPDFWASSLSPDPYGYSEIVNVPVISFADMIAKHDPTMLIVDIEGGELDLFDQVELGNIKKVYIELHQHVIGRSGMKRIFDFFHSFDFHYDQSHSIGGVVLLRSIHS